MTKSTEKSFLIDPLTANNTIYRDSLILKEEIFWMKFYISTYNCSNQKACNHLFRILPGTIARDLVTKRTWDDREHSNNVNFVVIITVREILDSIKDLLNGSAPHNRCVIEIKKLSLCSSRFEVESMNIISSASKIYC